MSGTRSETLHEEIDALCRAIGVVARSEADPDAVDPKREEEAEP